MLSDAISDKSIGPSAQMSKKFDLVPKEITALFRSLVHGLALGLPWEKPNRINYQINFAFITVSLPTFDDFVNSII